MFSDGQSLWLIPWFADSDGICSGATKKTFGTKKAEQIGIKRTKICRKCAKKLMPIWRKFRGILSESYCHFVGFSIGNIFFLCCFNLALLVAFTPVTVAAARIVTWVWLPCVGAAAVRVTIYAPTKFIIVALDLKFKTQA